MSEINIPTLQEEVPVTPKEDNGEILYAGKFKSVTDLESSYKQLETKFHDDNNLRTKETNELKEKIKLYTPPTEYIIEAEMDDSLKTSLIDIAKNSDLTQAQFSKMINALVVAEKNKMDIRASNEKAVHDKIGKEIIDRVDIYIDQTYPEKVAKMVKESYKQDVSTAEAFVKERAEALRKSLPTSGHVTQNTQAMQQRMKELGVLLATNKINQSQRKEYETLATSMHNVDK